MSRVRIAGFEGCRWERSGTRVPHRSRSEACGSMTDLNPGIEPHQQGRSVRWEEGVEGLCGLGLHAREDVGVGVERDPDARVPEAL
jgi:hypothetical protein